MAMTEWKMVVPGVEGTGGEKRVGQCLLSPGDCTGPPGPTHPPAGASHSSVRRRLPALFRVCTCFSLEVTCKGGRRQWLVDPAPTQPTGWAP